MSDKPSGAGAATALVSVIAILAMLITGYFFLDMTWLLQPVFYMASVIAGLLGGG